LAIKINLFPGVLTEWKEHRNLDIDVKFLQIWNQIMEGFLLTCTLIHNMVQTVHKSEY